MSVAPPKQGRLTKFYNEGFGTPILGFEGFGWGNWLKGLGEDIKNLNPEQWDKNEDGSEKRFAKGSSLLNSRFTWLTRGLITWSLFLIKAPIKAALYLAAGIVKFALNTVWTAITGIGKAIKTCVMDGIVGGGKDIANGKVGVGILKMIGGIFGLGAIGAGIAFTAASFGAPAVIPGLMTFAHASIAPIILPKLAAVAGYFQAGAGYIASGAQAVGSALAPIATNLAAHFGGAYAAGGILGLGKAISIATAIYMGGTYVVGAAFGAMVKKHYVGPYIFEPLGDRLKSIGQSQREDMIAGKKSYLGQLIDKVWPSKVPDAITSSQINPSAQSQFTPGAPAPSTPSSPSGAAMLPGFSSTPGDGLQGRGQGKPLTTDQANDIKKAIDSKFPTYSTAITVTSANTFNFRGRDDRVIGDAALAVLNEANRKNTPMEIVLNAATPQAAKAKMARMQPEVLSQLAAIEIGHSPPRQIIVKGTDEFRRFEKEVVAAQSQSAQVTPITPTSPVDSSKRRAPS